MNPCPTCPRKYAPVPAHGPQPARILCIAERPGADENRLRVPLVGKTGQEWNETYLPLADLSRHDLRVTNTVLCWADNNRTPTDKECQECAAYHLPQELANTNPEIVILMGGKACGLAGLSLEMKHGQVTWTDGFYGWSGWLVAMYHPAIGLHEGKWMTTLLEDWEALAKIIGDGYVLYETDLMPDVPEYRILRTAQEVNDVPLGRHIATDTETHGGSPYSLQFSPGSDMAFMVLAEDREAVRSFSHRLRDVSGGPRVLILHNAGQDLDTLERMGVETDGLPIRDTMQESYHLGNLPQGLKPLVYRLFRHTMTSWEDVVRPASIEALLNWMAEAWGIARQDLHYTERVQLKTKVKEVVKAGELERLLWRLQGFTDIHSDYDPWERLDEFWAKEEFEWMTSHVESRIGRYPILGIGNCTLARAMEYACGDALWTGRVAVELERRRSLDCWQIAEGDEDT